MHFNISALTLDEGSEADPLANEEERRLSKGLAQASGQHLVEPKITYTGCD